MESNLDEKTKFQIATDLFNEIFANVIDNYANRENKSMLTEPYPPKKDHPPIFLSDIVEKNNLEVIRTVDFVTNSTQKSVQLKQLKVIQQVIPNLCGYHTMYNLRSILKMLKNQNLEEPTDLLNKARFWEYHFKSTTLIDNYATKMKFKRDKYPWDYRNIRWGDLERNYLKILTEEDFEFSKLFLSGSEKVKASFDVFQFQFKRLIYHPDWVEKFQRDLDEFINFKEKDTHLIKLLNLGITNHWSLLLAHKYNGKVEFWLLDSKNNDYLNWNKEQIAQYLHEKNEEKKKLGKTPFNPFQLWVAENAYVDQQIAVRLLVDCMLGNTTLKHYIAHSHAVDLKKNYLETFCIGVEADDANAFQYIKDHLKSFINNEGSEVWSQVESFLAGYMSSMRWIMNPDHAILISKEVLQYVIEIITGLYQIVVKHGKNSYSKNVREFKVSYSTFEKILVK